MPASCPSSRTTFQGAFTEQCQLVALQSQLQSAQEISSLQSLQKYRADLQAAHEVDKCIIQDQHEELVFLREKIQSQVAAAVDHKELLQYKKECQNLRQQLEFLEEDSLAKAERASNEAENVALIRSDATRKAEAWRKRETELEEEIRNKEAKFWTFEEDIKSLRRDLAAAASERELTKTALTQEEEERRRVEDKYADCKRALAVAQQTIIASNRRNDAIRDRAAAVELLQQRVCSMLTELKRAPPALRVRLLQVKHSAQSDNLLVRMSFLGQELCTGVNNGSTVQFALPPQDSSPSSSLTNDILLVYLCYQSDTGAYVDLGSGSVAMSLQRDAGSGSVHHRIPLRGLDNLQSGEVLLECEFLFGSQNQMMTLETAGSTLLPERDSSNVSYSVRDPSVGFQNCVNTSSSPVTLNDSYSVNNNNGFSVSADSRYMGADSFSPSSQYNNSNSNNNRSLLSHCAPISSYSQMQQQPQQQSQSYFR